MSLSKALGESAISAQDIRVGWRLRIETSAVFKYCVLNSIATIKSPFCTYASTHVVLLGLAILDMVPCYHRDYALTFMAHVAVIQVVRATFGAEAVPALVAGIQAECDTHGSRLLQHYSEVKRLPAVVRDAMGRRGGSSGGAGEAAQDPRQVRPQV